jgi:hypothetical protein
MDFTIINKAQIERCLEMKSFSHLKNTTGSKRRVSFSNKMERVDANSSSFTSRANMHRTCGQRNKIAWIIKCIKDYDEFDLIAAAVKKL